VVFAVMKRSTVLVADDHALIREGLKSLAAHYLGDVMFVEACDADSLMQAAAVTDGVQLAFVGFKMPGMESGERLRELAFRHPDMAVVVVSAVACPHAVQRAVALPNVYAFLPRNAEIRAVQIAMAAALQREKLAMPRPVMRRPGPLTMLTPRQHEIRGLLRQGLSNKMIAGALGISAGTVKNHLTGIFKALHAANRTQAAQVIIETE